MSSYQDELELVQLRENLATYRGKITAQWRDRRNEIIREAVDSGANRKFIAELAGVSLARVSEIMRGVNVMPRYEERTDGIGNGGCAPGAMTAVGFFENTKLAALDIAARQGFDPAPGGMYVKRGTKWNVIVDIVKENGWSIEYCDPPESFFRLAERYHTALVFSNDHAAAVVDRKLVDTFDSRRKMCTTLALPA